MLIHSSPKFSAAVSFAYQLARANALQTRKEVSMSVVIVGGNDRMATRYQDICKQYKWKSKVFTQLPADFENKIGQPDLLVVFTSTCSHKMLAGVKNRSEKRGIPVKHVHSASVSALKKLLECYEVKEHVGT